MADPPRYPDTEGETGERQSTASRPRWVPVLGILIAMVLVLLVVLLHLTGTLSPSAH